MALKLDLVKELRLKTENNKSCLLDDSKEVKQKRETEPDYSSKELGKC